MKGVSDTMYSDTVMDHFQNPRNMGEIENADAVGDVGNPKCGDQMRLTLRVDPESRTITDIKFKTFGCGAAIASSSMVTELVKGKTFDEALTISNRTVLEELGGLPNNKMHCSVLAEQGIAAALIDYFEQHPDLQAPEGLLERAELLANIDPHGWPEEDVEH